MPALDRGMTYELNRLAGTLDSLGNPTLAAQGAAAAWANMEGLAPQGALNIMLEHWWPQSAVREVCNLIGQSVDEDPAVSLKYAG